MNKKEEKGRGENDVYEENGVKEDKNKKKKKTRK